MRLLPVNLICLILSGPSFENNFYEPQDYSTNPNELNKYLTFSQIFVVGYLTTVLGLLVV